MNLRTRQFVREYLIDLNGSAAARRPGYSLRSAGRRAFELLERPEVKAAVRAAMAARARRTNITADRVLEEFARIAFADLRRVSDWGPGGFRLKPSARLADADAAAVAWVSTGGRKGARAQRIRMHDKQRALEALARHLGLLRDGRKTVDRDLRPEAGASWMAALAQDRALADSARAKLKRMIEKLAKNGDA